MQALYLDLFSGISGDMFLGAMLDLGVDAHALEHELSKLRLDDYHLHASRGMRGRIAGTKFDVHLGTHAEKPGSHQHSHPHGLATHAHAHEPGHEHEHAHQHEHHHHQPLRTFAAIKQLIASSQLSDWVKQKAIAVFQRLAQAEGKIHGQSPDQVHFHEVGAVDSIIDIVGACLALDLLGRPRVFASSVVDGTGMIQCEHGSFPLPAPAALEILAARGVSLRQCDEPHELVTPTGAALLAEFVESFGPMQHFTPARIGYGLGGRENKTRPNVLRAILGDIQLAPPAHDWETDSVTILETNLDDLNPEILGAFMEKAMAAGALDVFYTPIQMKKNRPGVQVSLLCADAQADEFSAMLLRETSAFGIRRFTAERRKLQRESRSVKTEFGEISVKIGRLDGRVVQVAPEFESCKAAANRTQAPLKTVYQSALKIALAQLNS